MYCKKFCGRSPDFICQTCLLKEISAERIMEELISRKLVMVQNDSHTHKIQGYYIWRAKLEQENKKENEIIYKSKCRNCGTGIADENYVINPKYCSNCRNRHSDVKKKPVNN